MESAYDRALAEVGADGKFQKKFDVIYNVTLAALWCMTYTGIYLILVIPPHNCKIPEPPQNISFDSWKLKYLPKINDTNGDGENNLSSCLIYLNPDKSKETQECTQFTYDKTWFKTTVPSEYDWVCDKEIYVTNIYAYTMFSEILGSIFFGWFGDYYGRRLTYIISLVFMIFGRSVSVLAGSSYLQFVSGCIIASFPSWSVVQSATVISLEISSPERRTTTATLRYTASSFGICLMSLLYWYIKEWKIFMIFTIFTLLPFLFSSWFIIESPRWLWLKGQTETAVRVLQQIAKVNKNKLDLSTAQNLLVTPPPTDNQKFGPLSLFSSCTLAFNTILQLVLWICVSLTYVVLLMSSSEKRDGNPFLEFAWQSVVEMPGNFIGAWFANNLGRRHAGTVSFGVTALAWSLMACREHYATSWINIWWIGVVLRTVCRLSATSAYYTINLLNMELYPTCLRQSGMSLGNVFSSGASAIAPYIMFLGHRVDSRLPGVILSITSIVGIVSSYLLPETRNAKLPETLKDAQNFGLSRKKKYFSLFRSVGKENIRNLS